MNIKSFLHNKKYFYQKGKVASFLVELNSSCGIRKLISFVAKETFWQKALLWETWKVIKFNCIFVFNIQQISFIVLPIDRSIIYNTNNVTDLLQLRGVFYSLLEKSFARTF